MGSDISMKISASYAILLLTSWGGAGEDNSPQFAQVASLHAGLPPPGLQTKGRGQFTGHGVT